MEDSKVQEFIVNTNERMARFEERQEQIRTDMKEFKEQTKADNIETKETLKEIKNTVGTLQTADAIATAINKIATFDKQTLSRPVLVGIIVWTSTLILGIGVCMFIVFMNTKANNQVNTAAQNSITSQIKKVSP